MRTRPDTGDAAAFLAEARDVVGAPHVLTGDDTTVTYTEDWTRRWSGSTAGVVRPGSTAEVAALVTAARTYRVALVPQGGNTGLVGGGIPHAHEIVLSLRRMADVEPVDRLAAQVTAGAGAPLSAVQERARAAGLEFGVDLAARGSATIGGMVATNAGGLHVIRYGSMRAQVVGVEAVLGTGRVVSRLAGLVKDNTGYDLGGLLCGSEGTLGIVTWARLKLVPAPEELVVALVAARSTAAGVELAAELRRGLPGVRALEIMTGDSLRCVADRLGVSPPVRGDAAAYLLVEVEGSEDPTVRLAAALGVGAGPRSDAGPSPSATAVATTTADRARLWQLREEHSTVAVDLARERRRVVHKLDVTLPTAALADFCDDVRGLVDARWPGSTTLLYGHVGDGNIHVNVVPAEDARGIDDAVLALVVDRGGSVSAEHGIGVAKKQWLVRSRSDDEVAAMRDIKAALDPDGVLNPNVLLP